jgi:hypothetical protein
MGIVMIDWGVILIKYMALVISTRTYRYADASMFSDAEVSALREIEKEARQLLRELSP